MMAVMKVFICLFCFIACGWGFMGFTSLYNTHAEPPVDSDDYKTTVRLTAKDKWVEQKVDHFNPKDTRVWKMRYLENDRYFQAGGPIFIYVGGEWEITSGWISVGLMFDMAREMNGTMLYTEHRYYGKSHPTEDTSTKNLKYLTVEQALADLAHFIEHKKATTSGLENSGVILVGASYSGTIATWARLKYPHLVTGAWASSAPVLAKLDFYEYNEVMTQSIRDVGGAACLGKFENAFKQLEAFVALSEPKVMAKIKKDFNLCEPLKFSRDASHFFYELTDTVAGLVQLHKDGDIEKACKFLADKSHSDDVAALGAWMNSRKHYRCLDMNYENLARKFTNATWGSAANNQLRQWMYQSCDSFGWFQTGTSLDQAFGSKFPLVGFFTKMCGDIFDNHFTHNSIAKNIKRTNKVFNGLNPNLTNVYSTHGKIDPWRILGLQKDLNPQAPAYVIESYSHCSDLLSISTNDTLQMRSSKYRVKSLVRRWLKEN